MVQICDNMLNKYYVQFNNNVVKAFCIKKKILSREMAEKFPLLKLFLHTRKLNC